MSQRDKDYYKRNRNTKRQKWDAWSKTVKGQFITSRNKAKYNKQEWTLTFEEYSELRNQSCYYCSGPLPESSRGLDRIDNLKGYTLDNVVPCCYGCNNLKSNVLTQSETLEVIKLLKQLRGNNIWT